MKERPIPLPSVNFREGIGARDLTHRHQQRAAFFFNLRRSLLEWQDAMRRCSTALMGPGPAAGSCGTWWHCTIQGHSGGIPKRTIVSVPSPGKGPNGLCFFTISKWGDKNKAGGVGRILTRYQMGFCNFCFPLLFLAGSLIRTQSSRSGFRPSR